MKIPDMTCKRSPEYCSLCGRALIESREKAFFNPDTGERRFYTWHDCPRFRPSWRNGWLGGGGHESHRADNTLISRMW